MVMKTNWIAYELKRLVPKRFMKGGIDLNGDGKIKGHERISMYNKNAIPGNDRNVVGDAADWLAFYRKNHRNIHRMFGKLGLRNSQRGLFTYARRFKPTTRIHVALANESPLANWSEIATAYDNTWKILRKLRRRRFVRLTKKQRTALKQIARKKRSAYSYAMRRLNAYTYAIRKARRLGKGAPPKRQTLYFKDIKKGPLGYAALTYLMVTLADEMGDPIHAVRVPHNIFVRWDKRGVKINADRGNFHDDTHYIAKHNLTEALKRKPKPYLRSLKKAGFVAIVKRMVGEAYYRRKMYAQANRSLTTALKLDRAFVRAFNIRGMARYLLGDGEGAVKDFEEAIKRNPKYGTAWHTLGIAHLLLGQPHKAIADFNKAKELRPPRYLPHILFARSKAHYAAGNFAAAKSDIEEVIRLKPKFNSKISYEHQQLGKIYFAQKKYPLAIKELRVSLKKDGNDATTLFMLGRAHYLQGKYRAAKKFYDQAVAQDSTSRAIRRHRGMTNLQLGNYKAAVADFHKAMRSKMTDKEDVEALYHSSVARKALARKLIVAGKRRAARVQMRLARSESSRVRIYGLRISKSSSSSYPHIQAILLKATKLPLSKTMEKFKLYRDAYKAYKTALKTDAGNAVWIRIQMNVLKDLLRSIRDNRM